MPTLVPHQEKLVALLSDAPPSVFATISGAHLYGFESPDSDVDLRGAFVMPLRERLSLTQHDETRTKMEMHGELELDWVAHDIKKFAAMMLKRNGYVLEQVFSPLKVIETAWHEELIELAKGCVTKHLIHHYRGFTRGQLRELAKEGATVKAALYAYRVAHTGLHVLETGDIEANLARLIEERPDPEIDALLERKREGAEKAKLKAGEAEHHSERVAGLLAKMEESFETTRVREEATCREALDDFVVRASLELGQLR